MSGLKCQNMDDNGFVLCSVSMAKVLRDLQIDGESITDIKKQYDDLSDKDRLDLGKYAHESGNPAYFVA